MKTVNLSDIQYINFDFNSLEIFPELWIKGKSFSQYKDFSRPCSALFFICNDVTVTFYPRGGKPVTAKKGDLVWIPKGSVYYATLQGATDRRITSYTLNFNLLEGGEDLLLCDKITVLAHEHSRILETQIKLLNTEVHRIGNGSVAKRNFLKIKSQFFAFLDSIATSATENNDYYYPIRTGAEALKSEWNLNRSIEEYAEMCSMSSTYFYRCFKKWSGKSPVEYRNMVRLSNAETMLTHTDMKIGDISAAVGFEDPFYFCRIFSKSFGMSPSLYRKNTR